NAGIHALNTALVVLLFWRMTGALGKSLFVAALFGLHPMHVESVAWAVERKDTLSTFFGLLCLLFYVEWTRLGGVARYALCWVSLALSLMAKSMFVTAPCILVLLDVWPLRRVSLGWRRLTLEKLPLVPLSAGASVLTFLAQRAWGSVSNLQEVTFTQRVANATYGYAQYVLKCLWPTGLSVFYPLRFDLLEKPLVIGGALVLL